VSKKSLTKLLKERETEKYFISLVEKEFNPQEFEIFQKSKRYENE
jgi:hypothetical protein